MGPSIAGGLAFDRYGGTEMDAVAEVVRKSRNLYIDGRPGLDRDWPSGAGGRSERPGGLRRVFTTL
jgi:hypothetical protein